MSQPSLFDSLEQPAAPRPVNYEMFRKYLRHQLRQLRAAKTMPWYGSIAAKHAKWFPIYASELPVEEAADLIAQFNVEWARLTAVE
jgi:hypothetical protein